MSEALRFERLVVWRLPGFPAGGPRLTELSPGVNLVLGPNESGKSTAARALQGVLWPELLHGHYPRGAVDVEATLTWRGSRWTVRLDGTRVRWQKDGDDHPTGPALPPPERARRYLLSLHDLVASEDMPLAAEIRRLSAGGLDFDAAIDELDLKAGGVPRSASGAWRAAQEEVQSALAAARELQADERRLPALEAELARARADAAHADTLRRLEELDGARRSLAEAEARLDGFPPGMSRVRAGDAESWRHLTEELESAQAALADARAHEEDATAGIDEAALGEAPPERDVLSKLQASADRARELVRELDAVRGDEAEAREAEAAAREGLGLGEGLDPAEALPADVLDRVDELRVSGAGVRERVEGIEARMEALRGDLERAGWRRDAAEDRMAALGTWIELLRRWQAAGEAAPPAGPARGAVRLAGAVLAVLGAGLVAAGLLRGPAPDPLVAGAGLVVVIVGVVLLFLPAPPPRDPRSEIRSRARELGLEQEDWTPEGVRTRLTGLDRELSDLKARRRNDDEVRRLETEELPAARRHETEWRARWDALALDIGLAAGGPTPTALERLAPAMVAWDRAHRRSAETLGRRQVLEERLRHLLDEAGTTLEPWAEAPTSADELSGAVDDLSERVGAHREATRALERARADARRATERIAQTRARRAEVAERLGVDDGEVAEFLRQRAPRLEEWTQCGDDIRAARSAVASLDSGLPETADNAVVAELVDPDTGRVDRERLAARREAVKAAADRVAELQTEIGGIRRAVAEGRKRHDVERRMARRDEASAELAAWRDREREKAVTRALLERVRSETEDRSRPRVYERARDLMATITGGRYTIRLARASDGGFRAVSAESGRGLALDELSSGTRVQLLLAVRLAFVEIQEGEGATLPLLLDEVLGTSDDARAGAIVQAATALAAEGRQLIYFTAQADEVHKWREAVPAASGAPALHTLGGEATTSVDTRPALEWQTPEELLASVEAPEGRSHRAYGEHLGVGPLRLWAPRPVEALHPWHLGDDVEELHHLLRHRLDTWGRLSTFVVHAGLHAPERVRQAHARMRPEAEVCRDFVDLARRGRGRPVDRQVLAATDAVSDVFLERAVELARRLEGDARALIRAIEDGELKGFRSDKTDQLRDYLTDEGHLPAEEPLSEADLLSRLYARAQRLEAPPSLEVLERRIRQWLRGPGSD